MQSSESASASEGRKATPDRWQDAARRAVAQGIHVHQVNDSGAWIATSGTNPTGAYTIEVVAGVVRSCSCPAGQNEDAVCKHRAAYLLAAGLLTIDEPAPPSVTCTECSGGGVLYVKACAVAGWPFPPCEQCKGTGQIPAPSTTERAALVA